MRVLDPGHRYSLIHLDGPGEELLTFVKREGPNYPGNIGHYEGTTMQEVLRACIDRAKYVNKQIPCEETEIGIYHMREAIYQFELRAARLHGRTLHRIPITEDFLEIENVPVCSDCGHIGCLNSCEKKKKAVKPVFGMAVRIKDNALFFRNHLAKIAYIGDAGISVYLTDSEFDDCIPLSNDEWEEYLPE